MGQVRIESDANDKTGILLQTSEMLCTKISKLIASWSFFGEKHAGNIRKYYRNIGNNKGGKLVINSNFLLNKKKILSRA